MVRAAAKNYNDVVVITSSNQYPELINQLKKNNCTFVLLCILGNYYQEVCRNQ